MFRRITDETKDLVANLYVESNLKVCEIGALANLHPITIYKILNERDIPRRKELYNIELAIDMYEQGYYLREIYETTNISQSCLYKELEKRNVPRRRTLRYNYRPSRKSKYTNEILKLYKEGKSKSQIARELMIAPSTVSVVLSKEIAS